jgi:hypothetical protein
LISKMNVNTVYVVPLYPQVYNSLVEVITTVLISY